MITARISLGALALAMVAGVQAQAQAQAAEGAQTATPEPSGGVQEIVVTAQKRAENVQDVPIAISAFTANTLKERAVANVAALSNISPNVSLDAGTPFSGSTEVLSAYIRGIGANDFAFNIDPGVGVYLDGVYLARSVGANQDLLDVERIEVLKGPQGTLFGRNTIGGAISIVTRDPAKKFGFQGDLTTGSFRRLQARGIIDVPITDSLFSSISFGILNRKGYQKREPFPGGTGYGIDAYDQYLAADHKTGTRQGGDNSYNLRGKLKWDNGSRFRATISADYSNYNQEATPNSVLSVYSTAPGNNLFVPPAGTTGIPGTALDPTATNGVNFAGIYNFCIGATASEIADRNATNLCGPRFGVGGYNTLPGLASVNVDGDPTNDRLPFDNRFVSTKKDVSYANGNDFDILRVGGIAGTLEYDLTDNLLLKSITAYRQMNWKAGMDLDNSPLNMLLTSFRMHQKQFSQEVQLLGNAFDKKLNYVLGGYYFKESGNLHDFVTFPAGLLQVDGPNDLWTRNYAFFGQVDFRPSELLGFTVGGRYTHEDKRFQGFQSDDDGLNYKLFNCVPPSEAINQACGLGFPDPNNPFRYYVPGVNHKHFNNFSPKLGVQLHPTDRIMAYGSWSKGYKTGGWTTRLSNPLPYAPGFGPEHAETFEVGVKSSLLDRRLQLNAAAFTTKYRGIQLNFQQGASPVVQNAGDARIKGFEIEATVAPGGGFSVQGSVGYTDAYYTTVDPEALVAPTALQAGVYDGAPLPKTPHWKVNVGPRYEYRLGNGACFVLVGDYTHTTSLRNDTEGTFLLNRDPTDVVDASLTYRAPGDRYELTIGGTNITNERYLVTGQAQLAGGITYGTWNRPAEWYARLGVKF